LLLVIVELALAAGLVWGAAGGALAQSYPSRPLRFVVSFAPGGGGDILARIVAQKLAEGLGRQVVVDNRVGGNGVIGAELAARAAPDGYTMLLGNIGPIVINPSLYGKLPYDPERDFDAVVLLALTQNILVVHPAVPVKSVRELVDLARAKPGQLNYGSGGNGTLDHIAAELFKVKAGIDVVHIPYKGGSLAIAALLGGNVDMSFASMPSALPQVKAGKLKPLAVANPKRSPLAPDLPTMAEAGVQGVEASAWNGVLVPAKTPREIVARLNAEIGKLLQLPDTRSLMLSQGFEIADGTPAQFAAFIRAETIKWAKVISDTGIRAE
jgi:tripartite-type tricarboxylate transporter receptor subunit TctC